MKEEGAVEKRVMTRKGERERERVDAETRMEERSRDGDGRATGARSSTPPTEDDARYTMAERMVRNNAGLRMDSDDVAPLPVARHAMVNRVEELEVEVIIAQVLHR